jgi:hypothetical protein
MQRQQYTFEDWHQGKVVLYQARILENQNAVIVDWGNFSNEERTKIQECQKTIFEKSVKNTSELYIKGFHENFKRTKSKIDLLNNHLKRFLEVFNGGLVCDSDYCHSSDLELNYEFWYYQEMRRYIQLIFIGGNGYDFSNVHSPNSKFWDNDKIMPEVLVEAIGSLIRLLKSEKQKLKLLKIQLEKALVVDKVQSEATEAISINPFPDIFASINAFKFFLDLEKNTVGTKYKVADYSFIYHKLKDKKIEYPIKEFVSHSQFCEFLKTNRDVIIYPPRIKKRNPASKQSAFNSALEKFQESIPQPKDLI